MIDFLISIALGLACDHRLVHHGPLHRDTLRAIFTAVRAVGTGPGFGDLPTLSIHGEGDALAPMAEQPRLSP